MDGLELALDLLDRLLGADQLVAALAAGDRMGEHGGDGAAVLALEALERGEALLDLVQPAGRRFDALGVAVQVVQQVLGLERERTSAGRERVELGVDAGGGLERPRGGGQRDGAARFLLAAERARRPGRGGAQRLDVAQAAAL